MAVLFMVIMTVPNCKAASGCNEKTNGVTTSLIVQGQTSALRTFI